MQHSNITPQKFNNMMIWNRWKHSVLEEYVYFYVNLIKNRKEMCYKLFPNTISWKKITIFIFTLPYEIKQEKMITCYLEFFKKYRH
jgi:hypothetical protein